MAYTKRNTNQTNRNTWLWRLLALGVAAAVAACVGSVAYTLSTADTAYAKSIGEKNQQACDACNGTAPQYRDYSSYKAGNPHSVSSNYDDTTVQLIDHPDLEWNTDGDLKGYSTTLIDYKNKLGENPVAVWEGGNSHSWPTKANQYDDDPNDFLSVLPYGTIFIDTAKISKKVEGWYDDFDVYFFLPGTVIEINDAYKNDFRLFSDRDFAAEGIIYRTMGENPETLTPIKGFAYTANTNQSQYSDRRAREEKIAYVGDLTGNKEIDTINVDDAFSKPLIRITYPGAAKLSDGTFADVVISYNQFKIQSDNVKEAVGTGRGRQTFNLADGTTIKGPVGLLDG